MIAKGWQIEILSFSQESNGPFATWVWTFDISTVQITSTSGILSYLCGSGQQGGAQSRRKWWKIRLLCAWTARQKVKVLVHHQHKHRENSKEWANCNQLHATRVQEKTSCQPRAAVPGALRSPRTKRGSGPSSQHLSTIGSTSKWLVEWVWMVNH